ncbi:hypothetical protein TNCV_3208761 [Trichonephila clavipes]|nr:hypothetical protein TNCV_3208761 [Trichonephila clavipes]
MDEPTVTTLSIDYRSRISRNLSLQNERCLDNNTGGNSGNRMILRDVTLQVCIKLIGHRIAAKTRIDSMIALKMEFRPDESNNKTVVKD